MTRVGRMGMGKREPRSAGGSSLSGLRTELSRLKVVVFRV